MESVGPECTPLKQKYDSCFNGWYSEKFLKGDTTPECEELFKEYRACIFSTLREKGLDKLLEDSRKEWAESAKPDSGSSSSP
ncbi:MAG: mitochondrial distribution/morphology family 35/apoptosis [Olpidium bornovanus]|uniref:Mitochondrial distribution/morphology family 35/apoptosis n=1 Tax=Olpidium bornovanus TaxID=278681 RepID=A0A8H7ZXN7_9FUNG|nr:MAG: mitochondrial distribution/morphology family 35/apoptosis [Olpidium bornovanus]